MSVRRLLVSLVTAGVTLVALGACSSQELRGQPAAYDAERAERMFVAGYQDVTAVYIEDVAVADLALAGLEAVTQIDPRLSYGLDAGQVVVSYADSVEASLAAPGAARQRRLGGADRRGADRRPPPLPGSAGLRRRGDLRGGLRRHGQRAGRLLALRRPRGGAREPRQPRRASAASACASASRRRACAWSR